MKKLAIIIFFSGIFVISGFSQTTVGLRGGLNFARLVGDDISDDTEPITGFHGGLAVHSKITDAFAIRTEMLISQKGIKSGDKDNGSVFSLFYLDVPVMPKVSFGSDNFRGNLSAGPFGGVMIFGNDIVYFNGDKNIEPIDFTSSLYNFVDYGAIGSIGLEYHFGDDMQIFADFRYQMGFADVYQQSDGNVFDLSANHRIMQVSAGMIF